MTNCYVNKHTGEIIPELNVSVSDFTFINNNTNPATFEEVMQENSVVANVLYNGESYQTEMPIEQYFDGKNFFIKL